MPMYVVIEKCFVLVSLVPSAHVHFGSLFNLSAEANNSDKFY